MLHFIIFMIVLYFSGEFIVDPLLDFFDITGKTAWYIQIGFGVIVGLGAAIVSDKILKQSNNNNENE